MTTKKPNVKKAMGKAIEIVGLAQLAKDLGVTYQAMRRWQDQNRMPDTEFSCRTHHSETVEKSTSGQVTVTDLLGHIPVCQIKK